jgi:Spy/CpxP family protein refolding chaperone
MRDPSLVRGPDGTYHLVWTTGWHTDQGFGYASSKDLVHWSEQKFIPAMEHEPTTVNVWAPELFYDERARQFVICWASTIPGRFPDFEEARTNNHRMYYTTTKNLRDFARAKLFFDPGFSVIDGCIVQDGNRYVLIHKDNSRPKRNLRVAFGETAVGPWRDVSEPFTEQFTEGPSVLKVGDDWLIYYDAYRLRRYGAAKTRDFNKFSDISGEVSFPEGHKHGTVLIIERSALSRLLKAGDEAESPGSKPAKAGTPNEEEYTRAIEGRTRDILAVLRLEDAAKSQRIYDVIIAQYRALRAWHDTNDAPLNALAKELSKADRESSRALTNRMQVIRTSLQALHANFISKLAADLTPEQVERVKDKMTYNKVQVTYDAYLEIMPNLTEPEKIRILELLKEAREEAMDGGSAEEKSATFRKYKGRINNYLSQEGHDVARAYKDWGAKQKSDKTTK